MYRIISRKDDNRFKFGISNTDDGKELFYQNESNTSKMLVCWWSDKNQSMIKIAEDATIQKILKFLFEHNI